jgi:hypothetical protein
MNHHRNGALLGTGKKIGRKFRLALGVLAASIAIPLIGCSAAPTASTSGEAKTPAIMGELSTESVQTDSRGVSNVEGFLIDNPESVSDSPATPRLEKGDDGRILVHMTATKPVGFSSGVRPENFQGNFSSFMTEFWWTSGSPTFSTGWSVGKGPCVPIFIAGNFASASDSVGFFFDSNFNVTVFGSSHDPAAAFAVRCISWSVFTNWSHAEIDFNVAGTPTSCSGGSCALLPQKYNSGMPFLTAISGNFTSTDPGMELGPTSGSSPSRWTLYTKTPGGPVFGNAGAIFFQDANGAAAAVQFFPGNLGLQNNPAYLLDSIGSGNTLSLPAPTQAFCTLSGIFYPLTSGSTYTAIPANDAQQTLVVPANTGLGLAMCMQFNLL